eukprot:2249685-Pyramimonas_sp.AAC.1
MELCASFGILGHRTACRASSPLLRSGLAKVTSSCCLRRPTVRFGRPPFQLTNNHRRATIIRVEH